MTGVVAPNHVSELVRRGRCAACRGRLVVLSDEDGGRVVACFSCGREVATVATAPLAPYWQGVEHRR